MHFLVLAYDVTDDGAAERRMAVREDHISLISAYREKGNMLMGAAIEDDNGKMIGSVIITDFPSRVALDAWLAEEPYMTHNVWGNVAISPCAVGPSFMK